MILTHPTQLRATAALWSLRAALAALDNRTADEARAIIGEQAAAADPLKSPLWGRRHALGGHGDPTGDAVLTLGPARSNRWAVLADEVQDQLAGVARELPPASTTDLDRFAAAIPAMSPTAATATRKLLDRIDSRIRRLLHEPSDRQLVPRIRCPACDAVGLAIRTSAPLAQQVVECITCDAAWWRSEMLEGADG